MKKLATALAALACITIATPGFACPNSDRDKQETADQTKKDETAKTADKVKDTKPTEKAAEKTKDTKPATKPIAKG
jgi:hypothetical protein